MKQTKPTNNSFFPFFKIGIEKIPPLIPSIIIAELFFKFGSFTLELLAFFAVWVPLAWIYQQFIHQLFPSTFDKPTVVSIGE